LSAGPEGRTVQIDLRAVLPVAVLALVVLTIIFVEICGREDVKLTTESPTPGGPTATVGPTFTPGPTPTVGPEQETATAEVAAGGEDRDQQRQLDLADIQDALEAYFEDEDEYPNTNGNIQTVCVFEQDIGCALTDVIDPIPSDPLGEPAENGYFYQSDGETYVLYAIRESELLPECDEHPEHLAGFDSIMCLRGPAAP
jgi:hypothetical protein